MHLIYTADTRIPSQKAHPYQIVQMCEAFADAGIAVTLLYANRRNLEHLQEVDIWDFYGLQHNFSAEALPCLDLYALANLLPPRLRMAGEHLAASIQTLTYNISLLIRLIRERDSLIYSRDPISLWLIALLWSRRARRLFFEAHTYPATRAGLFLRRQLAKRIGGFVVITEHLRQRYESLSLPAERLLVAHDGFRRARFEIEGDRSNWRKRFGWPSNAFIVGYMGRFQTLGMDKGLDTLVEAIIALASDRADKPVRLAVVGGPAQYVDRLCDYLERQGVPRDTLLYPGQVPPADVPGYLRAFDVCVMPFPWTEHFAYYASPMKLFEYMASGSPIVATDLPSTKEILCHERNALLIPPSDASAMAQALRRLRDDPELAGRLTDQAAHDVLAYTWEARAQKLLTLFEAAM